MKRAKTVTGELGELQVKRAKTVSWSVSTSRSFAVLRLPRRRQTVCRLGGCPAGCDRCGVEGTQRAVGCMSGDHDRCFSTLVLEAFRQVFFNANALPCITIGADVWGKSGIMTGVY